MGIIELFSLLLSSLERLILKCGLKGPSWLHIKQPSMFDVLSCDSHLIGLCCHVIMCCRNDTCSMSTAINQLV